MKNQIEGLVVGAVAAIMLVPIVRIVWQQLAPAAPLAQLSADARRKNALISREAIIAGFGSLGVWALERGLDAELGPLDVATAIGIILGAPFWWVLLRTKLQGPGALAEYAAYLETQDGISFRSLSVVAMVATVAAASCGLISYVRVA